MNDGGSPHDGAKAHPTGLLAALLAAAFWLAREIFDLLAGFPPVEVAAIDAWLGASYTSIAFGVEVLAFAAVAMIPVAVRLYRALSPRAPHASAFASGVLATVIALFTVLVVIQGRLAYPVFGYVAEGTEARLLVSLLYGGIHHALLLLALAVGTFGVVMVRSNTWRTIGIVSLVVAPVLVVASYPELLGPLPTFIGRGSLSLWLVAVGVGLDRSGRRLES